MFNYKSCTASVMLGRDLSTSLNRRLYIRMYQEYRNPLNSSSVRDTERKVVWLWKEYCVVVIYGSFFVLFLFVSLRVGHSKCDKGKIRSYTILVSGVHAFRLKGFMNISVGCEVQYWTSVDANSHEPGASVQRGGKGEERLWWNGGKLLCSNYKQHKIRRHKRSPK